MNPYLRWNNTDITDYFTTTDLNLTAAMQRSSALSMMDHSLNRIKVYKDGKLVSGSVKHNPASMDTATTIISNSEIRCNKHNSLLAYYHELKIYSVHDRCPIAVDMTAG
jgi:hypothetical protein